MPSWLCPVCKTWLDGNIIDGTHCSLCGYSEDGIGREEFKHREKEREKNE